MPLEAETAGKEGLGSLSVCFVEGDAEQRARERKGRRRALTLSVVVQTILVAALLIVPLFAKTPPLTVQNFVPIPPYVHSATPEHNNEVQHSRKNAQPPPCRLCPPTRIPTVVRVLPAEDPPAPLGDCIDAGPGRNAPTSSGLGVFDIRRQPQVPPPPRRRRIVQGGQVQAAMLVYRVAPIYPALMRQIRKSGRVELHAIISTDGTIESLQAISGDPGFYKSALDAVQRWRYKPTILNGQPVEVETVITVIYNIG